ncbi:MAG: hypothetical protein ACHQQQ_06000 [Bacteroidota bacterium]
MKITKIIIIGALALIGLRNNANAQSLEVPTGPFLDSAHYVPPHPLKKNYGKNPKHVSNSTNKIVTKKTDTKKGTKRKILKTEKIFKKNKQKNNIHKK